MMSKKLFEIKTKTIVAIGLGAALFTLLFMFVKIPTGIPETQIQTAYGVGAMFAAMFGPIAGFLIAFIGHALSDAVQYGSPWWSWVVSSGISCFIVGLCYTKLHVEDGIFEKKDMILFNVYQIVANALAWILISPVLDIVVYGEPASLELRSADRLTVIVMAGLQGAGKTTTAAKLGGKFKEKGRKVLLAACDVYRPAAINQLKVIGEQIGVPVYSEENVMDPVAIARNAVSKARQEGYSLVIVDTAGRLAVDEEMMDEIAALKKALNPTETLFVVDAMTGQDAVETARAFNDRIDFDGVVLTKMDGDTRGGAALSIKAVVGKPIKFISSGEKMEALDVFHPKRIADRILGMGDVVTLVEKAQEQFDEEQARKLKKKLAKNQFTLTDFYDQIQQIKKMGNIKDIASMIPGVGKALKDVEMSNDSFKGVEAIILSMTPLEREKPEIINGSRRKRIADGSGTSVAEVNRLLKQFEGMRKVMKSAMGLGGMQGMMKNMRRPRR